MVDLHHEFEVSAGLTETWEAFLDMPRLAPCMPGAEVTEVIDDRTVKGAARVKVGPINLRFAGDAELTDIDHSAHSALLVAKGSDVKGRGNAAADVGFSLRAVDDETTHVNVETALDLTGSVAQYGRAAGLIDEIANQLLGDFVANVEVELGSATTGTTTESDPATETEPATETDPATEAGTRTDTDSPTEVARPTIGSTAKPVSGLRLLARAVRAMVARWFRRSP